MKQTEGGLTGVNTQGYGKPGKRHGAKHYCNNRRTPRTEEQPQPCAKDRGRHDWAMSGRTTAATACADGRHVLNGSPFTVYCYHMHFLIRSRSARNSPNLLSLFSPASSPGRNVCYQSLPDIVQLRNITAITLPMSVT